jgi:hypothetical protein
MLLIKALTSSCEGAGAALALSTTIAGAMGGDSECGICERSLLCLCAVLAVKSATRDFFFGGAPYR